MKYSLFVIALIALPFVASAHERHVYEINGINYQFVVGSASEQVYVDDKSGAEVRVEIVSIVPGHEEHHHDTGPGAVLGLEETLKVELIAEGKTKVLDLDTVYGQDGLYRAAFYPTATSQIAYRFFGTIEDIPIDLTFTCSAEGHEMEGATDATRAEVSAGVVLVSKTGRFSCPRDKSELGFPYDTRNVVELHREAAGAKTLGFAAGALALAALGMAFWRRS